MNQKQIGITVLVLLFLGVVFYALSRNHASEPFVAPANQEASADVNALPPDYDPQDEERWMNDYWFRADGHERIATAEDHAYFCKLHDRYEGSTSCYLFLEKDGVYTSTGLVAQDVDTTLLVSSDSKNILVIEPYRATLIRVADDVRRTLYDTKGDEYLGYYANTNFTGSARWRDNDSLEIDVFSDDDAGEDSSPLRTISLEI